MPHASARLPIALTLVAAVLPAGCTSPLDRDSEQALREQLIESHRRKIQAIKGAPTITTSREPSAVEQDLPPERKQQLDQMSGPQAYLKDEPDLGQNLVGETDGETVEISLRRAIQLTVEHNLDLGVARLSPAIAQTPLTQAEAAFDFVLFGSARLEKLDTPRPQGAVPGLAGDQQDETLALTTGIRKDLITGGRLTLQTGLTRLEQTPSVFGVPSFYDADVRLQLDQPLLRGFGADVNRAQIVLARSARRAELQQLRSTLLQSVLETEAAYWDLFLARANLLIQQRLLQRTINDRDRLIQRREFDASPVRITEANSFVELRRADVIRASQRVRDASDELKRLMNAPDLPVSGPTLVATTDRPADQPVRYSLLDSVSTALQQRPELQQALLSIKDASVRQRVADNARLPLLNLTAAVEASGLDADNAGGAYESLTDVDYIDYIIGGEFEYPLGNREAEARFAQRRLERRQAVLDYRQQAQDVVIEVKDALRGVLTQYELIGATRAARRAAADSLRAIEAQEAAGAATTPEFLLDLKLQTQQRLANAEVQEAQAYTDYATAIARLYRVIGTLLQRNQIDFDADPTND